MIVAKNSCLFIACESPRVWAPRPSEGVSSSTRVLVTGQQVGVKRWCPLWAFLRAVPWKITFFVLVFVWCLTQSLTILINTHVIWKSVGASNTLSVVNVGLSTELRKSQCFIFLFTFYFVIACVCILLPKLLLDICFFMILIVLICLDDTSM